MSIRAVWAGSVVLFLLAPLAAGAQVGLPAPSASGPCATGDPMPIAPAPEAEANILIPRAAPVEPPPVPIPNACRNETGQTAEMLARMVAGISVRMNAGAPFYLIDGVPATAAAFSALDPASILSISEVKPPESIVQYGEEARNGATIVRTRGGPDQETAP